MTPMLRIAAREIEPGDYLPPQRALHGTRYQDDGFVVGDTPRDVVEGLAALPGRMLLYGPAGSLQSLAPDAEVAVDR